MTYSLDFRQKVLSTRKAQKLTFDQTSTLFGISKTTILKWIKNIHGQTGRNKPATKIDMEELKRDIEQHPDAYQYERARRLGVSRTGLWSALKRLKVTYKKNSESSQSMRRKATCLPKEYYGL